jgi:radical SAM superfamily enzyme YgiQ (UPF0313 family)
MKILLVAVPHSSQSFVKSSLVIMEPLALEYIGAGIKENHEVKLLDLRVDSEPGLKETLESFQPDIIGCGAYTTEVNPTKNIFAEAKKILPGILTVIGGIHATVKPEDFFENTVDVVVVGEGILPFRKICDYHEKQKSFQDIENIYYRENNKMAFTREQEHPPLDTLPLPDRTLTSHVRNQYLSYLFFDKPVTVANIRKSLGCYFNCNFCTIPNILGRKLYTRNIDSILEELASLEESLVLWVDDEFLLEPENAISLAKEIGKAGIKKNYIFQGRSDTIVRSPQCIEEWAKVGLMLVFIGMEAHSEKYLKEMKKNTSIAKNEECIRICHKNNVQVQGGYIVQPGFNKKDFKEFARYVRKSGVDLPNLTVLTPFPGTELYEEKKGEFITHNYNLFDMVHSLLPTNLPLKQFYKELAALFFKKSMPLKKRMKLFKKLEPQVRKKMISNAMQVYKRMKKAHLDYNENL